MNYLRDGILFVTIDENNVLGDLLIVEVLLEWEKWFIERPRMCSWEEIGKKMNSIHFLLNNFKIGQSEKSLLRFLSKL